MRKKNIPCPLFESSDFFGLRACVLQTFLLYNKKRLDDIFYKRGKTHNRTAKLILSFFLFFLRVFFCFIVLSAYDLRTQLTLLCTQVLHRFYPKIVDDSRPPSYLVFASTRRNLPHPVIASLHFVCLIMPFCNSLSALLSFFEDEVDGIGNGDRRGIRRSERALGCFGQRLSPHRDRRRCSSRLLLLTATTLYIETRHKQ